MMHSMANQQERGAPFQSSILQKGGGISSNGRSGVTPPALFHTVKQLAVLETSLHAIAEGINRKSRNVSFFCREYWGSSASLAQLSLDELGWSDPLKRYVQQACILESLSLALLSQLASGTGQGISVPMRAKLRTLIHNVYQNCLVLFDLVHQRWITEGSVTGSEQRSQRRLDLNILIEADRFQRFNHGEHSMALRQHNDKITGVLQQLCQRQTTTPSTAGDIIDSISEFLHDGVERMRARTVRSSMLQRFRFQQLVDDRVNDDAFQMQFSYERLGENRFANEGIAFWFTPLPPMWTDLEAPQQLPPLEQAGYTLVLDLDETLIHSIDEDGEAKHPAFSMRPGMVEFVSSMSALGYEIVVFTTATQDYADYIINQIDPQGFIHHRLYRQHTLPWGPVYIKDLSRLGRNLDQSLIIDNLSDNFLLQPENGITIKSWYDDPHDQALYDLTPLLTELINTNARVPDILRKYADEIPMWAGERPKSTAMKQPQTYQSQAYQQPQGYAPQGYAFVPVVMQTQPMMMFATAGSATGPVMQFAQAPGSYGGSQQVFDDCRAQETPTQQTTSPPISAMSPTKETQKSKRLVNIKLEKTDRPQDVHTEVDGSGGNPSAQMPAQATPKVKKGLMNKVILKQSS